MQPTLSHPLRPNARWQTSNGSRAGRGLVGGPALAYRFRPWVSKASRYRPERSSEPQPSCDRSLCTTHEQPQICRSTRQRLAKCEGYRPAQGFRSQPDSDRQPRQEPVDRAHRKVEQECDGVHPRRRRYYSRAIASERSPARNAKPLMPSTLEQTTLSKNRSSLPASSQPSPHANFDTSRYDDKDLR